MTKIKKENKIFLNLAKMNKLVFALFIVGFVYYVSGVNDLSVKGFKLQEMKKQVAEIEANNKELELKVMNLSSYNNLSERIGGFSMVPAGSVSYVTNKNEVVAKK